MSRMIHPFTHTLIAPAVVALLVLLTQMALPANTINGRNTVYAAESGVNVFCGCGSEEMTTEKTTEKITLMSRMIHSFPRALIAPAVIVALLALLTQRALHASALNRRNTMYAADSGSTPTIRSLEAQTVAEGQATAALVVPVDDATPRWQT